jgi:transposase
MTNAMLDARQEGDSYRRIEVITGQSRRRRWTAEEKARIVAESLETDANISEVARRNGVARGLLTAWRHRFAMAARSKVPSFVPVQIDAEESSRGTARELDRAPPAQTRLLEKASRPGKLFGVIEIEVSGARIRVEPGVELTTLATVLSALRGGR